MYDSYIPYKYADERVGNLCVVAREKQIVEAIKSQLAQVVRANWGMPPSHGALIVHMILTQPDMRKEW